MFGIDLPEEETFEQRLEGGEGTNLQDAWGKSFSGVGRALLRP